jgi:Saccharopine dehydrogenase NADP binding domain
MKNEIAIYGAYGHTGKFIVALLYEQGYKPILCGRDSEKLLRLSQEYPDLTVKVADITHPKTLDNAFFEADMIINCAGPFLDTAEPIIQSALRLRKHYLDISAEQKAVLDIFEQFLDQAKSAGIVIIPAAAFYGGLGDLLSTMLTQDWHQVDEITIYIGLDSWHPTKGTRLTGQRNHYQRWVFADSRLQPLQETKPLIWHFPPPIENKQVIAVPLSEIITISRHINVAKINTYISQNSIADLRNTETPKPIPFDKQNRSSQQFCMEVVAIKGNKKRTITAQGIDIYAVTAPLIVQAVKRIGAGKMKKQGVTTLGEAFDATDFLRLLSADDINLSTIRETEIILEIY